MNPQNKDSLEVRHRGDAHVKEKEETVPHEHKEVVEYILTNGEFYEVGKADSREIVPKLKTYSIFLLMCHTREITFYYRNLQ